MTAVWAASSLYQHMSLGDRDSSFASPVGKETAAISAKQQLTIHRYHWQSTDTPATVYPNISAEVLAECQPTYRPIVSTDTWPTLGWHIDRVSADCQSAYRPIVSTDTQLTDALSTQDPKNL